MTLIKYSEFLKTSDRMVPDIEKCPCVSYTGEFHTTKAIKWWSVFIIRWNQREELAFLSSVHRTQVREETCWRWVMSFVLFASYTWSHMMWESPRHTMTSQTRLSANFMLISLSMMRWCCATFILFQELLVGCQCWVITTRVGLQ